MDYYQVLGVTRTASADELRKAYKKLARENHPDTRPNDAQAAEKFMQVQEAYEVLGDADKRQTYDQFGSASPGGGRGGPRGTTWNWSTGPGGAGQVDLGDVFGGQIDLGDLLGGALGGGFGRGARRGAPPQKGQDVKTDIEVPFQVAAEGGNHELTLRYDGKVNRLTVKVPAGVDHGSVIRLAGQGAAGPRGGPSGDVLVTIKVASHPYFRRDANQLLIDVPVTVSEAALGAKVEVPTLSEGTVVVKVPPGSSSGTKLRLRGKGIRDQKTGKRGDQVVVLKIVVPQKLDAATKSLFEQLAAVTKEAPRTGLW